MDKHLERQQGRRTALAAQRLRLFVAQYARKAPKQGDPNDRRCSRDIARKIKRMKPDVLDALLRDGDT